MIFFFRCGDNKHGPLGHGFENFFGLPFTLISEFQFQRDGFWTVNNVLRNAKALHLNDWVGILAPTLVWMYQMRNNKIVLFITLGLVVFTTWLLLEHTGILSRYAVKRFISNCAMAAKKYAEAEISFIENSGGDRAISAGTT